MHLPQKQSDVMIDLAVKLRGLTELLCADLDSVGDAFFIDQSTDLFASQPQTQLLLLLEGQVEYHLKGKVVMCFDAGDILGLPRALNLPTGTYTCSSFTKLLPIDRDVLMARVNSELRFQRHWAHYLLCNHSFYEQALAQEMRSEFQPSAGFLHFRASETIIHQGQTADRVYTLLEGNADALRDGVKVGEVNANEIFGALAVFTRQPRMASVVARSDCTVLAVRKEEFIDLIEHQPQVCMGLIEEMATKINQLNSQILSLSASA